MKATKIELNDIREILFDTCLSYGQRLSFCQALKTSKVAKHLINDVNDGKRNCITTSFKCGKQKSLSRKQKFYCCNADVTCWCDLSHASEYYELATNIVNKELEKHDRKKKDLEMVPLKPPTVMNKHT